MNEHRDDRATQGEDKWLTWPQHPDGDSNPGKDQEARAATSRRTYVLWIAGIGVVVLMVVLHLPGVFGPGSH
jgi:hypothetical protein